MIKLEIILVSNRYQRLIKSITFHSDEQDYPIKDDEPYTKCEIVDLYSNDDFITIDYFKNEHVSKSKVFRIPFINHIDIEWV